MHQELVLAATCEQTVSILIRTMSRHGYRLERSFDLRNALDHHPDCPCPHHGTLQCTCQYVVLLAYGPTLNAQPTAITVHECDGLTRVRVADGLLDDASAQLLVTAFDEAVSKVLTDA